jgi:phospho-N-acetylmuramoyl-pentapeptide-transferase
MVLISAIISFLITAISGKFIIEKLRVLKFGQTIYEEGPAWHKAKNGTPTMGGIMFLLGVIVASVVSVIVFSVSAGEFAFFDLVPTVSGLLFALGNCLIGFIDDYIKVVKKRNLGLTGKQKLVFQFLIAAAFLFSLFITNSISTDIEFPFGTLKLGFFYYPLMMLFIVFVTNAVNLTDGIDGLAATTTSVTAIGYVVIATYLGYTLTANIAAALLGGVCGFLIYNSHPAKVFMGDTGSMFLGGMVVMLAFTIKRPELIVLMGAIYIIEALSVVLQVISFKTTGKRIFLMSPIHHHYEKKGLTEKQIVARFSTVELIFVILAVAYVLI